MSDLVFDPETQRLFAADSAGRRMVALDALALDEESDSPIRLEGPPVSVEILDLRPR